MLNNSEFMGSQPVRVLEHNVLKWFEEKYPEFRSELEGIGAKFGSSQHIRYFCKEEPIQSCEAKFITPFVTVHEGEINLHETFLTYLWGLSYAFLVIFDEHINGPRTGKTPAHGKPIGYFRDKGFGVLDYSLSLIKEFKKWPSELPNPECHDSEDRYFVEKANGIYLSAVDFILCHELAHIACGHLKRINDEVPPFKIKEFEKEADKWALQCVSKGIQNPGRNLTTVGFGAIVGLGSLLFLNLRLTSETHPDKNKRIQSLMSGLSLDDMDNLWGIVAAFYMAWDHHFNVELDMSGEFATYKELIYLIEGQLDQKKRYESSLRLD